MRTALQQIDTWILHGAWQAGCPAPTSRELGQGRIYEQETLSDGAPSAACRPALQEASGTKDIDLKTFTERAKNNCPRGLGRSQQKHRAKPTEGRAAWTGTGVEICGSRQDCPPWPAPYLEGNQKAGDRQPPKCRSRGGKRSQELRVGPGFSQVPYVVRKYHPS